MMTLDTVDVAVLPDGTSSGAVLWNNFVIRDDGDGRATVATELIHGAQEIVDEDSVRIYEQVWGEVSAVAARGASARALIGAAGTES